MAATALTWQASLFGDCEPAADPAFPTVERRLLAGGAWVDCGPGWLAGADQLFATLLDGLAWESHRRWMYDRVVDDPRLTVRGLADAGADSDPGAGAVPGVVGAMADLLGHRYGVEFTGVSANLYRDGRDSVAWHGDRVARDLPDAVVALVSLGGRRPFLLRPKGGGPSVRYDVAAGDLLVMGGSCQRTWDHSVPKVRTAQPRISVMYRHAYD